MKVTLEPDWTNNVSDLTATITIKRTQGAQTSNAGGITLTVGQDDFGVFAISIPGGTSTATFEMSWKQDWSKDATNDLDLFLLPPGCFSLGCSFFDEVAAGYAVLLRAAGEQHIEPLDRVQNQRE